ncbi:condensation domain-containing protein [Kitasatospora sp. SolWspMP-SS2h]|uniref:condensation domain-containing protein n=1 Tax=Kitasatospora sp. SolWspMP-SS2h TaxID=1305729 RepID=UPI000DBAAC20|nr:condensation domain-containing protein [Kitasatospora sp. SolWspMP-SS2h]RAJ43052.1 condensation domain-containing protein [Kitasatospora sp. SolWspMP-SS2h]
MLRGHTIPLRFDTDRAGTGPLIWGQIAIWDVIGWLPPDDASLNALVEWPVPDGRSVDDVLTALRTLVERHDSLRTLVSEGPDGPRQRVLGTGSFDIGVHDLGSGPVADAVAELGPALHDVPFDYGTDLPLRVVLLTRGDEPLLLLLSVSHMAVDGWSFTIVQSDFERLIAGETLDPPGQQPLERAEYEASAQAIARESKALDFWAGHMATVPARMIATKRGANDPDFTCATIDSPALAAATRSLAIRCGIDAGAVLQGAVALLLAAYTGEQEAVMRKIVATRFQPGSRSMVAPFNQNALFRIDITDEPFTAFLGRCVRAAMLAYWHSEYHPRKLESMVAAVAGGRGITPDGYCFFNDARFAASSPAAPDPAAADAAAAGLADLLPRTTVTEERMAKTPKGANFFADLFDLGDRALLHLYVENGFFAPRGPADFLRDVERLLARAAAGGESTSVRTLYAEFS